MNLKSKGRIIFFTVSIMLLIFFLLIGFGVINFQSKDISKTPDITPKQTYQLETNYTGPIHQIGLNDNQYTESELENIRIYEALNKGVVNITTEKLSMNWFLEP
ncbi:MAG: peptidase S1, partial [Spirochaetaceae bacterium]|nr:peptidase S1 [Spirochaetaceae bacterium]